MSKWNPIVSGRGVAAQCALLRAARIARLTLAAIAAGFMRPKIAGLKFLCQFPARSAFSLFRRKKAPCPANHVRSEFNTYFIDKKRLIGDERDKISNPPRFSGNFSLLSGRSRERGLRRHTEKYLACGWWTTMAEVDCSGSSWSSSERVMPISSAPNSANSCFWSARLGHAG
jgi:hypothetical protein